MSEMKPSLRLLLGYAVLGCGLVWGQDLGSSSALVRDHAGPTHQITGRQARLSIPRNQIWRAISNALHLRGLEEGELHSARDLDYSGAVPTAQGELLEARANPASPGSLWVDNGLLANLAADYKAVRVGDLIRILVVQDLTAVNSGDVATERNFKANSGIDGLFGHLGASGVQNIFAPQLFRERHKRLRSRACGPAWLDVWLRCSRAERWWWKPTG